MIPANELRIGNCFFIPGINRYVRVSAIYNSHFRCKDDDGVVFDESVRINYQPITLTPEVLEKCGGLKLPSFRGSGICIAINRNTGIEFHQNERVEIVTISDDDGEPGQQTRYPIDCKSLHQLQNLYFALTGVELTVNL